MRTRQPKKRVILTSLITLLLILSALTGWFAYKNNTSHNIFPSTVTSAVSFSLFYPKFLPQGYALNKTSFQQTSNQVVTFFASDKNGHNITFSIQERPSTFDFDSFYSKSLSTAQHFTTDNGDAVVGSAPMVGTVGSLVSGDSWVLVTSNQPNMPNIIFQTIVENLTPTS